MFVFFFSDSGIFGKLNLRRMINDAFLLVTRLLKFLIFIKWWLKYKIYEGSMIYKLEAGMIHKNSNNSIILLYSFIR